MNKYYRPLAVLVIMIVCVLLFGLWINSCKPNPPTPTPTKPVVTTVVPKPTYTPTRTLKPTFTPTRTRQPTPTKKPTITRWPTPTKTATPTKVVKNWCWLDWGKSGGMWVDYPCVYPR